MPWGTACHRLRKLILFAVLQRHGENVCFRCGEAIVGADDLSIEHKEPWDGRDVALFWNLDNIAFAHRKCNVPHTFYGGRFKRKIGPDGTSWCGRCCAFYPTGCFHKNKRSWNGLSWACKNCRRAGQGATG